MKQVNRCIAKEFYPEEISDIICKNQDIEEGKCNLCRFWGTIFTMNRHKYVKRNESSWVSLRLTPVDKMLEKINEK